ncbi:alpha/beta fold hydrolase [Streptomyces sp. NPDC002078]
MQRITAEVSGRPMVAWRIAGGPPPVVCVHGAGVSSRGFGPFLEVLGLRHDAWTVDLPGFGASAGPPYPLGLRALADAVVEWLTAVGLEQVVLLGGSFGCQVAVDAAVRHPDRVAGLVLVGPTVDPVARGFMRQLLRWMRNAPHERVSMAPLNLADHRDAGGRRIAGAFTESLRDRIEAPRTGSVPYWTVFGTEASRAGLESYLDASTPYDEIRILLFDHGTDSIGLADAQAWQRTAARAGKIGVLTGVDAAAYPRDFAGFVRSHRELSKIRRRCPMPLPLDAADAVAAPSAREDIVWRPVT